MGTEGPEAACYSPFTRSLSPYAGYQGISSNDSNSQGAYYS